MHEADNWYESSKRESYVLSFFNNSFSNKSLVLFTIKNLKVLIKGIYYHFLILFIFRFLIKQIAEIAIFLL